MRLKIYKPLVGGGRGGANKEITILFIIAVDLNAFMYMLAMANESRSAKLIVARHLVLRPCLVAIATFLHVNQRLVSIAAKVALNKRTRKLFCVYDVPE